MKKTYELWLDESGDFTEEALLKGSKKYASLIGGILIEKEQAEEIDLNEILFKKENHAMEMTDEEKRTYALPVLEKMHECGARQVFFENTEYEDEKTNRQLYLRMMAEGLLQLLQTLNAEDESVLLKVIIAQRQDMQVEPGKRRIGEEEYLTALRRCIGEKRSSRQIFLHEDSKIQFAVRVANKEKKLQIADFACNTRLTRNSGVFAECRDRVRKLHETAYLFKLSEVGTMNYIKRCLVQEDISSALMELYLSRDQDASMHKGMLKLIMRRIDKTNYRLMKSQMKKYTAEITAYAAKQEDYEVGEKILLKINEELIPLLKKSNQPYQKLQITILLQLADMYLREGDIDVAATVLEQCEESHRSLGNQLEDLQLWYEIQEKKSLLYIRSFDYKGAVEILENVCKAFEGIIGALAKNELVSRRFGVMNSEYYGDALCMRIYALMFMQRENPELYETLCQLSDIGLKQYPDQEEELERHRQYRSHIEMEAGNFEEALRWLLAAKCCHPENIDQEDIEAFFNKVWKNDDEIGRQYYFLYYLLIMCEGKLQGNILADEMYAALENQKRFLREFKLISTEEAQGFFEIPISKVSEENTGIFYHPQEIINWKYATYLWKSGSPWKACSYYEKAVEICFKYPDYDAMQIIGIGITAEYICCLNEVDKQGARRQYESLLKKIEQLKKEPLPAKTRGFLLRLAELSEKANKKKGKVDCQYLWEVSRKICF